MNNRIIRTIWVLGVAMENIGGINPLEFHQRDTDNLKAGFQSAVAAELALPQGDVAAPSYGANSAHAAPQGGATTTESKASFAATEAIDGKVNFAATDGDGTE